MGAVHYIFIVCFISGTTQGIDYQAWSEQGPLGKSHTLSCNDSTEVVFVNSDDSVLWEKNGRPGYIAEDDQYELIDIGGIKNMSLHIKSVTDGLSGLYFCHVFNSSGQYVGRIVKAINLNGPLIEDSLEEYRRNIVVGAISAGAVIFLIFGVCLIDNFQYLTPEQKFKRKEREAGRLRRDKFIGNGVDIGGDTSSVKNHEMETRKSDTLNGLDNVGFDGLDNVELDRADQVHTVDQANTQF
ncbi:unnamed protein product [Lymnaea stagnalis]|uniref:Ig-like domain-containing protein n=1 Tax=Lymnaea stagnalis TaxID=6523 RepID=A0AAV2ISV6_LYMST